ncbi:Chromodomain-helicase-DNA-binding protein 5 [Seminavis robusta]|uniref:Chromodomain-helicase-DNA-binding protein 5 n=1 Tax=Seminavis robusta TaxID=568900 RepID=A0A9N8H4S5_9STRA|nr:Chromodomain-helicase-DNA-binding protein 5 [Seminavis robusta]|eukprot:Sro70_g039010.1 Chromodomain-helicase-DNA-binding protein 5 (706) ;mRNA; r:83329-85527
MPLLQQAPPCETAKELSLREATSLQSSLAVKAKTQVDKRHEATSDELTANEKPTVSMSDGEGNELRAQEDAEPQDAVAKPNDSEQEQNGNHPSKKEDSALKNSKSNGGNDAGEGASSSANGHLTSSTTHGSDPKGAGQTSAASGAEPEPLSKEQHVLIAKGDEKQSAPATEPRPKLPSAVEEVTKVVLPNGFLNNDAKDMALDPYSKLANLWSQENNNDAAYETWTNPKGRPLWDNVKPPIPRIPAAVPPGGTPDPSSDESDVAMPQAKAGKQPRVTPARRKIYTMATDVYADTRYIGVFAKKAKLMKQGAKTTSRLGRLDAARFRDYKLLPVDYFVGPMEGLRAEVVKAEAKRKEKESDDQDGSPSGGRPRRRRRKPQEHAIVPPPPREPPKKCPKTSVRVGRKYQASIPPRMLSQSFEPDMSYVPQSDQIWDPKLFAAAIERGERPEDIDGFLAHAIDLNSRLMLMESLHRANYNVANAIEEFVTMFRESKEPTSQLYFDEILKSVKLFQTSRKEFGKIAKEVGRSTSSILVQYYQWKGRDEDGVYSRLKREWKAEDDYCQVCDDGGILLVCDLCHKAYHLGCLVPPLKEMPKTPEWYCSQCLKSPAKLRRLPSISFGGTDSKPAALRALPFFPAPPKETSATGSGAGASTGRASAPSVAIAAAANSGKPPARPPKLNQKDSETSTPTKASKPGGGLIDLTLS